MLLFWLLLLGLCVLAYFAVRGRMIRLREEFEERLRRAAGARRASLPGEDMTKCSVCGTYSAPGQQKNCGRDACPYKEASARSLP